MQGPDVLVVGDANPDLVLTGDVIPRFGQQEQLLDRADWLLGGSAAITAAGLGRLGVSVALAAWVGDDTLGRDVVARLTERAVDVTRVRVHPSIPTGLTVVLAVDGDRSSLTYAGTVGLLTADDVGDKDLVGVRHVHVASLFLQPGLAASLPALLRRAHVAGATTSLDTNWDPSGRWDGLADILPHVDVLLPNAAELLALAAVSSGTAVSANVEAAQEIDAAARILTSAGTVVALKDGSRGGRVWSRDGVSSVAAQAVAVVDAIGAGDSFNAGFIAGFVRGLPVSEALRWAVACGSLSVRAAGGTAAQPDATELAAFLDH